MNQLVKKETRYNTIPIFLNGSNHTGNSVYKYRLPASGVKLNEDDQVALVKLNIYFSWRNVTQDYGNNRVTLTFGTNVYNVVFPDGNYDIPAINNYLKFFMKNNNLSREVDISGQTLDEYYLVLEVNPTEYKVQIISFPTVSPIPGAPNTPQITFNEAFGRLIGFNAGTYPPTPQTTRYEILSNSTAAPQISPVESVLIRSNLISQSAFSVAPDLLAMFTAGGAKYGELIQVEPNDLLWVNARQGQYSTFDFIFQDNNYNTLKMLDFDITMMLMLKVKQ